MLTNLSILVFSLSNYIQFQNIGKSEYDFVDEDNQIRPCF